MSRLTSGGVSFLRTGEDLLTDKQKTRLAGLFAHDQHLPVEVGWCVYQDVIAAYRDPDKTAGKTAMTRIIDSLRGGVPAGLDELAQLGRTLHRRRDDILAWFTHPGASNGPTEDPSMDASSTSAASPSASAT